MIPTTSETETVSLIFPTVSQNTVEVRFTNTMKIHYNLTWRPFRYSDKIVGVSQNIFAAIKVKP